MNLNFNVKYIQNIMKILITASAGFIGFNLAAYLMKKKCYIIGIDNYIDRDQTVGK